MPPPNGAENLIRMLVEVSGADTHPPTVYASHEAADLAYQQRLLG